MVLNNIFSSRKVVWVYILSFLFIAINALLIANEWYYSMAIPFGILIIALALFSMDKLVFLIVFCVPLSIPLLELMPNIKNDMYLPTEPMLAGIMFLFLAKLLLERKFDRKIALHPVSIFIYINIFWIFVTSITSSMPIVSFKFLIARVWFLATFYFIATQLFRDKKNIRLYIWMYVIPLLIVIGYTIKRHLDFGFYNQEAANYVPNPFYSDHTSYGAVLAFYLPVLLGFIFGHKIYTQKMKIIIWIVISIVLFAIVLSYTRATWVSLLGALAFFLLLQSKLKFRTLFFSLFIGILVITNFSTELLMILERNRQDSSANLSEHIESIANVTSDASNMERLNRWYCAFRMVKERPVFGWGPGTYMFKYAPFQFSYDKTIISTNAGDVGNAHSEYIGPLADSGIIGTLSILGIILTTLATGMRVYRRLKDRQMRAIGVSVLLGLVTYYIHGVLNNFLDTDKVSAPFWGFTAILVALDVYYLREEEAETVKGIARDTVPKTG